MKKNENNNKTRKNGPKGPLSQGTPEEEVPRGNPTVGPMTRLPTIFRHDPEKISQGTFKDSSKIPCPTRQLRRKAYIKHTAAWILPKQTLLTLS
jgi:hypothetical protein